MATPAYSAAGVTSLLARKVFFAPPAVNIVGAAMLAANYLDMEHGGAHRVVGTVKEKATPANVPVVRRVRLCRMRDGVFIRETWSAPDGSYVFDSIDGAETYYVVSFDHTGNFNAAVADRLVPEPMP